MARLHLTTRGAFLERSPREQLPDGGVDPGYFAVYMGTSPEKMDAALAGIREQLVRVRDEPVPEAELSRAKQHLIGTHKIGLQRNGSRAALLALDACYGLGMDNFPALRRPRRCCDGRGRALGGSPGD